MTTTARVRPIHLDLPGRPVLAVLGWTAGIALPLVCAMLYRTYGVEVEPHWLELTRQMGLPYIAAEVWFVMAARRRGFDPAETLTALSPALRWALLTFLATFWISSAFVSRHPDFSIAFCLFWVVHLLFGAAVHHRVTREGASSAIACAAGFAAGLAVLVPVIAVHFLTPPSGLQVPYGALGWGSAIPGFISHRLFGAWAGVVLALLLGFGWRARDSLPRWLFPAVALAAGLAYWSGTRAAVLGVVAALVVARLVAGRPTTAWFWPRAVAWMLPACVLGAMLNPYGDPSFMLIHFGDYVSTDAATGGRLSYWMEIIRIVVERPLLGSGAGAGAWLTTLPGSAHYQPHNVVLQLLLHSGVVAAAAALFLLGVATWRVHRALRLDPTILPLVMMLDCLLVIGLVDGTFHFAQFCMLITALFGACLARGRTAAA